jgi:hypothetical protein
MPPCCGRVRNNAALISLDVRASGVKELPGL